ncbi:unnamed protein product, partial [marine sediment metagenome]
GLGHIEGNGVGHDEKGLEEGHEVAVDAGRLIYLAT